MKSLLDRRSVASAVIVGFLLGGAAGSTSAAEGPVPPAEPAAPPGGAGAEAASDSLPPGVLARVDERDITVEEYVAYLFASLGKSRLGEYINRLLLDEEGRRLGVKVEPAQVEGAVEDRIDRIVRSLYAGDRERYVAALEKRRTDLDDEKARLRQELYYDMLAEALILRGRKVDDAAIDEQFARTYGEGGVEHVVRHILVSTRSLAAGGESRSTAEARARAEKVLQEIQGGGLDFLQAVKQYSDDPLSRQNDGRIPNYRKELYGEGFHRAVAALTTESPTSGVVESPRGFHIVQLVEKRVTRLEDVGADLRKLLETRAPTPQERQALITGLRAKARIEGL